MRLEPLLLVAENKTKPVPMRHRLRQFAASARSGSPAQGRSIGGADGNDFVIWLTAAAVAATTTVSLPAQLAGLGLGAYGWRLGSMALAAAMLACSGFRLQAAWPLFLAMTPWMAALTALTVIHLDHPAAWLEWLRHAYMLLVGACVFAGSQTPAGRTLLTRTVTLMLVGLLALSVVPAVMLLETGWTWEAARLFKARSPAGLSLNTFIFLFALLVSAQWMLAGRRLASLLTTAGFLFASILFATRAPLYAAVLAAIVAGLFAYWRSGRALSAAGSAILSCVILGVPLAFLYLVLSNPGEGVAHALAGRAQLWQISFAVWQENPVVGAGPDALASSLAGNVNAGQFFADWRRESLLSLTGGGFHNIWLETLASKGLLGLFGLFASYFLLLRLALASAAAGRSPAFLFFTLLLLSRGYVEVSGLFSYENSPHDFVAFAMIAASMAMALAEPTSAPQQQAAQPTLPRRFGWQVGRHGR
jgi:O-antigen ligase